MTSPGARPDRGRRAPRQGGASAAGASRHNPQFESAALARSLAAAGIGYAHAPGLGGFRPTSADSPNKGWRNESFRGYADYMQSAEFAQELIGLEVLAAHERVAVMCAEAVPWRCHRSLIADALTAHGIPACEIASARRLSPHRMTPFARVRDGRVTYPAESPAAPAASAPAHPSAHED